MQVDFVVVRHSKGGWTAKGVTKEAHLVLKNPNRNLQIPYDELDSFVNFVHSMGLTVGIVEE